MTWPNYSPATRKAVNDLLKRGGSLSAYRANKDFGSGPVEGSYAYRFEREVEKRFRIKHAVAVNSGTAALQAAIVSSLPKSSDASGEIIVSPYTFSASASAIVLSGFTPVFADVDPYTYCITPETVKPVLTKKTRAILPVSLFGGMADVRGLRAFGVPVIEDACQAVGARDQDGYSGSQALAAAYSMNGGKNIPAGECGMMVTNDFGVAERARLVMNHAENFNRPDVGFNFRPNEVTACIAYHGLLELEERNRRRQELVNALAHEYYSSEGFEYEEAPLELPYWNSANERKAHVYYVTPFLIRSFVHPTHKAPFIESMKRKGVTVGAGYINPTLEKYKAFRKYCAKPLPVVTELSEKTLCLLSTLTPDRPLSYAKHVAKCMRESLP